MITIIGNVSTTTTGGQAFWISWDQVIGRTVTDVTIKELDYDTGSIAKLCKGGRGVAIERNWHLFDTIGDGVVAGTTKSTITTALG